MTCDLNLVLHVTWTKKSVTPDLREFQKRETITQSIPDRFDSFKSDISRRRVPKDVSLSTFENDSMTFAKCVLADQNLANLDTEKESIIA
jgi:hypothetical protein